MNQDTTVTTPAMDSGKQKDGKGWKLATAIASILAVCGIGFGIYGMTQSIQKDDQITNLKMQLKKYEGADTDTDETSQAIPDNYIAVFHGGVGERTYETYVYKDDNGQDNYGFTYINTTSTTKSYGSSEWKSVITKRGSFGWTDDAFAIAKENSAYSYVTIPDSDKTYSIDEFQEMFIMN